MKKLIFTLSFFGSFLSFAAGPEIVGPNDSRAIVGSIADVQVDDLLKRTSEFKECRDNHPFVAGEDETKRNAKIKKAQECFEGKLKSVQDPKRLQELSDSLNLQRYGLVKSKNVRDIQSYLNAKMYKAMTGVDPDEADKKKLEESLKFKNKKHIDQAVFIKLYKTQLTKNALFEISRYCFQDLRKNNATETNFGAHWAGYTKGWLQNNVSSLNDEGKPAFASNTTDPTNKEEIYQNIFSSVNVNGAGAIQMVQLEDFFLDCALTMVKLCDSFKDGVKLRGLKSEVDTGLTGSTPGANSCLAKSRLEAFKKGLADADKIEGQFKEMLESDTAGSKLLNAMREGMKGTPIQLFVPGSTEDNSLDALTTYSTQDVLRGSGSKDANVEQLEKDCQQSPGLEKCAGILFDQDKFDEIKHNVEQEMLAKREVERARVRKLLSDDKAKLKDYLEERGMFNLAKNIDSMTPEQIDEEIQKEYDAKKIATLSALNSRLGSRQVKKTDQSAANAAKVDEAIKDSKEERARLAQVVLFNNIITSQLELTREDGSKTRNVNAWKKEEKDLQSAQVNAKLFQNLQSNGQSSGTAVQGNEEIGGIGLIDKILGK